MITQLKQNLYTVQYDTESTIGTISVLARTDRSIGLTFSFLPIEGSKIVENDLKTLMVKIKEQFPGCVFDVWLSV